MRTLYLIVCATILLPSSQLAAQTLNALYSFPNNQGTPYGGLIQASDGNYYGTTFFGGSSNVGGVYRITPSGEFAYIYSFSSDQDLETEQGMIQGGDGNFYGTSIYGGSSDHGALYEITTSGQYSLLASYPSGNNGDSQGGIIQGSDGSFYGTLEQGGTNSFGEIFRYNSASGLTPLYSFLGTTDGYQPATGVLQGTDGDFYGVTCLGGSKGSGTVFKVDPLGNFTLLYTFTGAADGGCPKSLIEGTDGNFYGATPDGGSNSFGTFFRLSPAGMFQILYNFAPSDPQQPTGNLILGSDGNFYGVAQGGLGGIYAISPSGAFSTVSTFTGDQYGYTPFSGLVQGSDGEFYGTTTEGGDGGSGYGVIYTVSDSPPLSAPVSLTVTPDVLQLGKSFTLAFRVLNGTSTTMQQCFLFTNLNGSQTALGRVSGQLINGTYVGSLSVKPVIAGVYSLALTCGGIESGFATVTVNGTKDASATALQALPYPVSIGQPVSLKATVTGSGAAPTGAVALYVDGISIGSFALHSGSVTIVLPTASVPIGNYLLSASYSGDANYLPSSSTPVTVVLTKANTVTTLIVNPNPVTIPASITLTAKAQRSAGSTGLLTGDAYFFVDGTPVATVPLNSNGIASFTASTAGLAATVYDVNAVYGGDASDIQSSSTTVSLEVK